MIAVYYCLLVAASSLMRLSSQITTDEINALDQLAADPNLIVVLGDANSVPLIYARPSGYLNSWAVVVNDGQAVANKIASQYGFTNLGQVSLMCQEYMLHCQWIRLAI